MRVMITDDDNDDRPSSDTHCVAGTVPRALHITA